MKKILHIWFLLWLLVLPEISYSYVPSSYKSSFPLPTSPLKFTENKGQLLDKQGNVNKYILFTGKAGGVQFYLTTKGIIYKWSKAHTPAGKVSQRQLYMELLGANPQAKVVAEKPTPDVQNYFGAFYPATGITGIRSFQQVTYKEVYPHIDFVIYTNGTSLKYDFVVKPGGDPSAIRFSYKGHKKLKVQKDGSLLVTNPIGKLIEGTPYSYQHTLTGTAVIGSTYQLKDGVISFRLADYNTSQTLVIDPAVAWATYYGGSNEESALTIETDANGNLYGVGYTKSEDSISFNGHISTIPDKDKKSALLLKFNAQQQLVWATYFGTNSNATDVAIDKSGAVFITGSVEKDGSIPEVNSQKPLPAGGRDSFVAKFNADGIPLWTTYYGGSKDETVQGIALDQNGDAYITGYTISTNENEAIATLGAHRSVPYNANACPWPQDPNDQCFTDRDVFLAKFNTAGQRVWSTYYGGETSDLTTGIAIDNESNIYIHGRTTSRLPVDGISFNNTIQTIRTPTDLNSDAFIGKFNKDGVRLWGTYFGGDRWDDIKNIAFDEKNNLYLAGETQSKNLFTDKAGPGLPRHKDKLEYGSDPVMDGFIVKINHYGTVQWSTYYGGKRWDSALKVLYNGKGILYISGYSESITESETESISAGNLVSRYGLKSAHSDRNEEDAFIIKFDTTGTRLWGAYFGGTNKDTGHSIAFAPDGKIYLSGITQSFIPMPDNAHAKLLGSQNEEDGYIVLIDDEDPIVTALSPVHNAVGIPTNANTEFTFSEAMAKGSGDIIIKQGSMTTAIPVTDPSVSIAGNKVVIDAANFAQNTLVEVQISGSVFTDLAGNPFSGLATGTWQFTTAPDLAAPNIISKTPENGSSEAERATTLMIEFDEDVSAATGTITVYINNVAYPFPASSESVLIDKGKVSLMLPEVDYKTNIAVEIDALSFKDPAGNFFPGIAPGSWQFTVKPDLESPILTSLSPVNGTLDVAIDTDAEIVFNESITLGTGSIFVKQDESIITHQIKIEGNKVTIGLPALKLGTTISIEISNTALQDASGNFFAGIPAGEWQFTTLPSIAISPAVFEPVSVTHTGTELTAIPTLSITLNPNPAGTRVALYTRGSSNEDSQWVKHQVDSAANTYSKLLPTEDAYNGKNKMGVEYYFEITPPQGYGLAFKTGTGIAFINHQNGLEIPMVSGSKENHYRLISIPLALQESAVSRVFSHLEDYNIEKWRLYRYENDGTLQTYQEYTKTAEFTQIQTGKAYWIIARDGLDFASGQGSTLPVSQAKPYVISLKPGWNLIGNPYDMHVSWQDVQQDSLNKVNAPWLGELFTYQDSYQSGDLMTYSGGFVWADQAADIRIPLLRNKPLNGGRLAAERPLHHQGSLFEVNFTLASKDMHYPLAGLGMHPFALEDKDSYDRYLLPRFSAYLDVHFAGVQNKPASFTKHIVGVREEYQWEFIVETNTGAEMVELNWHNYFSQPTDKQLYLYDVAQEKVLNMQEANTYKFNPKVTKLFRVYYGSASYISKHLKPQQVKLNQNVPNPVTTQTMIGFSLPEGKDSYKVELGIYSLTGHKIATLAEAGLPAGFHQINWDGTDSRGNRLPAGLYICKLLIGNEKDNNQHFIRIIIR